MFISWDYGEQNYGVLIVKLTLKKGNGFRPIDLKMLLITYTLEIYNQFD